MTSDWPGDWISAAEKMRQERGTGFTNDHGTRYLIDREGNARTGSRGTRWSQVSHPYWVTVEYLGAGFVLQRKRESDGDFVEHYDADWDKWTEYHSMDATKSRCPERVIHINDAENIDTSTIDSSRLMEAMDGQ